MPFIESAKMALFCINNMTILHICEIIRLNRNLFIKLERRRNNILKFILKSKLQWEY